MTTPCDFYNVVAQAERMASSKYYAERIASRAASLEMVLRCVITRKQTLGGVRIFLSAGTNTAMQVLHRAM